MQIRTIIVDDEDLSVALLKDFCAKIPFIKMLSTFDNAIKAKEYIATQDVDLILLDIQMPYLSGIQFIENLANPPMVIFITAYPQYALEGFRLSAVDYLLKPFLFDRFEQAVKKAIDYFSYKEYLKKPAVLTDTAQPLNYLFIKSNYQMVKVEFDDILYIEGLKQYIKIFTVEKMIITLESLQNIHSKLPGERFLRVHKSFIVSKDKINALSKNEIWIKNKKIPVGRKYRENMGDF